MNPEFEVHILSEDGIKAARMIANVFDETLNQLIALCPEGREFSIVKTKMEEASFFAKKAMAKDPENWRKEAA